MFLSSVTALICPVDNLNKNLLKTCDLENNPGWLPALHLGHSKSATEAQVSLAKEKYDKLLAGKETLLPRKKPILLKLQLEKGKLFWNKLKKQMRLLQLPMLLRLYFTV